MTAVPVTVVTAAAPNGNRALSAAVPLHGPDYRADFRRRMHHALRAAHAAGCSTVILGAWGCGVFRNRPDDVAALWSEVLDALEWRGRFACMYRICCAVWQYGAGSGGFPPCACITCTLMHMQCYTPFPCGGECLALRLRWPAFILLAACGCIAT